MRTEWTFTWYPLPLTCSLHPRLGQHALCERTWAKLSERKNDGEGEGGEGRECKPKTKTPDSDMRKNPTQG